MEATVRKWGNSVGVRIPKEALASSNISLNDDVEIIPFNGGLTIQKKNKKNFGDIANPLVSTKNWKFDREEANERR